MDITTICDNGALDREVLRNLRERWKKEREFKIRNKAAYESKILETSGSLFRCVKILKNTYSLLAGEN